MSKFEDESIVIQTGFSFEDGDDFLLSLANDSVRGVGILSDNGVLARCYGENSIPFYPDYAWLFDASALSFYMQEDCISVCVRYVGMLPLLRDKFCELAAWLQEARGAWKAQEEQNGGSTHVVLS